MTDIGPTLPTKTTCCSESKFSTEKRQFLCFVVTIFYSWRIKVGMLPDLCQANQETNKLAAAIIPNPVIQRFLFQRQTVWCCIRKQSLFVYRITRNILTTSREQNADHAFTLRPVAHLLITIL